MVNERYSAPEDTFSLDWRFLPKIPTDGSALILYADAAGDATWGLTANFDPVVMLLTAATKSQVHSPATTARAPVCQIVADIHALPFSPATFELIAFPVGLPVIGAHPDRQRSALLASVHRWLSPTGVLYIGFPNRWSYMRLRRKPAPTGDRLTLWHAQQILTQAGFLPKTIYAAIPDHRIPEFLFPLQGAAVHFALKNYLKRKKLGRVIAHTIRPFIAQKLTWGLPAYCIVAEPSG